MDLSQMTEVYQSMTVLGSIGGLALALLGFTSSFSFV